MQREWINLSYGRRWSGLFILVVRSHALGIEIGPYSDDNLRMMFCQMGVAHCERRILDRVLDEEMNKVMRLGNFINLHMYSVTDGASGDGTAYSLFNWLIGKRLFVFSRFRIGSFK